MCKYCEPEGTYFSEAVYCPSCGGWQIVFNPEDVGYLLRAPNMLDTAITHCPWCGTPLNFGQSSDRSHSQELLEELVVRTADVLTERLNIDRHHDALFYGVYDKFRDDWLERH